MKDEEIEFIKDYSCCWKKGDRFRRNGRPQFAAVVIEIGYAKVITGPPKHKMVEGAERAKELII